MKAFKVSILVALVAMSALAVIASPAFATTTATTSVTASAPFITPIGNTQHLSSTTISTNSTFAAGGATIVCPSTASSYVPATHTQALITTIDFASCAITPAGTVSGVTTSATSAAPWKLHVTSFNAGTGSSNATLEIPAGGSANILITLGALGTCNIIVGPQSVTVTFTNTDTSIVVNDNTVAFTRVGSAACPPSGNATQTGNFTIKDDTAGNNITVTAAS